MYLDDSDLKEWVCINIHHCELCYNIFWFIMLNIWANVCHFPQLCEKWTVLPFFSTLFPFRCW